MKKIRWEFGCVTRSTTWKMFFVRQSKKGRLSADELEVLRFMTLVPAETGISVQRFEEWTGLSKEKVQCLQLLRRKGWLEYDGEKEDVLWWEKPFRRNMHTSKATPGGWIELKQYGLRPVKGVYFMLMSLGDVLSVREETMPDEKRCYRYIGKCFDKDSKKTSFWGRTVFNTQVELLVRRFKETSNVFTIINLCWELYSGKEITNKLSLNEKEKLIGYFIESLGKKHYFNTFWYISLAQSYLKEKDELKAIMNIEKAFKCCKMDDCQLLSIKVYDIVWRVCLECEHIELASKYFEQVLELRNKYLHPEIEEMIQYHVEYAMKCMTESLKYGLAEKDRQNHYKEAVRCLEKEIEYCIKECGEEEIFEYLDAFDYKGKTYVILIEAGLENKLVTILSVEDYDEKMDTEEYAAVKDQKILNEVYESFKARNKEKFDFTD